MFRHHAGLGLQALEAGAAALHPGAGGGTVRVGVLPTAATELFPRVALRFRDAAPGTILAVETGPHSYLIGLLRSGAIDLMIGRRPVAAEMAGLVFEHLYEDEVALVARAEHPLRAEPIASILPRVPVILAGSDAVWFISRGVVAAELARGDLHWIPTGVGFLPGAVGVTHRQGEGASELDLLVRLLRGDAGEGA